MTTTKATATIDQGRHPTRHLIFLFRKNTIANNLAPRSNANPSFHFRKFKPPDHCLSCTHLQPHADNEHHFEYDKCHSTSFVKLTTLRTPIANHMHCYAHAALRSYLPPEVVAEGAARTPNQGPYLPLEVMAEGAARTPNQRPYLPPRSWPKAQEELLILHGSSLQSRGELKNPLSVSIRQNRKAPPKGGGLKTLLVRFRHDAARSTAGQRVRKNHRWDVMPLPCCSFVP
ncbi:uncharacterized protein K444DRAFT_125735 [Hyaloscypha bicolor E]|uniref:Uncharacterized protein n=1 Tax=Hyaloscypha bicolor E TaxID=1095630 RepID=A0A2J6TUY4_9HELO|nr:uncharacterized protein K444DRAFT_125735 [Hyaloscypha bicolor E]PMD66768.1 hypothetical protein K444DRAFT_125735 [Hyaloscypha bicolor E]